MSNTNVALEIAKDKLSNLTTPFSKFQVSISQMASTRLYRVVILTVIDGVASDEKALRIGDFTEEELIANADGIVTTVKTLNTL